MSGIGRPGHRFLPHGGSQFVRRQVGVAGPTPISASVQTRGPLPSRSQIALLAADLCPTCQGPSISFPDPKPPVPRLRRLSWPAGPPRVPALVVAYSTKAPPHPGPASLGDGELISVPAFSSSRQIRGFRLITFPGRRRSTFLAALLRAGRLQVVAARVPPDNADRGFQLADETITVPAHALLSESGARFMIPCRPSPGVPGTPRNAAVDTAIRKAELPWLGLLLPLPE